MGGCADHFCSVSYTHLTRKENFPYDSVAADKQTAMAPNKRTIGKAKGTINRTLSGDNENGNEPDPSSTLLKLLLSIKITLITNKAVVTKPIKKTTRNLP